MERGFQTSAQADQVGASLQRAFAQPAGQSIPKDFLKLLAELDRTKRGPS
jgi:hypothetical protein